MKTESTEKQKQKIIIWFT